MCVTPITLGLLKTTNQIAACKGEYCVKFSDFRTAIFVFLQKETGILVIGHILSLPMLGLLWLSPALFRWVSKEFRIR